MPKPSLPKARPTWFRWRAVSSMIRIGAGMRPKRWAPRLLDRRNISARGRNSGRPPHRRPKSRLDNRSARRVDQVHVIDIGLQAHFGACIARAARLNPAAVFGAVDGEEHHRLHAHRLEDIQSDVEIATVGAAVVARLGNVLWPQAENHVLVDGRSVTRLAVRR